jgi:Nucleotide modification associated domain 2
MTRLFSYVVEHDLGFSPNPFGGYCTLAHCKFRRSPRRRNVVELATKGDWVVGTGGASQKSSGHRTLIYAMKVTDKLTLQQYFSDERFRGRADNHPEDATRTDRFALVSNDFFYFGVNAVRIPAQFLRLEKKGPGFRDKFDEPFITKFEDWLRKSFRRGVHGEPCGGRQANAPRRVPSTFRCRPQIGSKDRRCGDDQ